ncbi:putative membrane protein YfcA [Bradyrhizobium yuanmingense]
MRHGLTSMAAGMLCEPCDQPFGVAACDKDNPLETLTYVLLLLGALAGGFVSGLAGFGTALMALGIWLYVLPPSLAVPLVLICSVIAQTSTLPSMWKNFDLSLVWPFLIGGLIGVPLGTMMVASADPEVFRLSVGVLILIFSSALYLNKRPLAIKIGGRIADGAIGFAGGILGGLAGLSGPLPILWANIRGWNKHERRGIFQLFNFTVLATALVLQTASGLVALKVVWLAAVAFPGTLIGAWAGARVYHALNDKHFGDVVLGLLFLSGLTLVWNSLGAH